eukprot:GEZU01003782.1.p1 GENE.GEZU01003782.1~~GEZU01003782.1.p1  ORF type:complete len:153 (-),score=66.40 GEZU01003782.1:76-534(-)
MSDFEAKKAAKLKELQAKVGAVRTGGKGSVRRKVKKTTAVHGQDDKKLQGQLKKLGLNQIQGIEEVNFFMEDSSVLHFENPKVQGAVNANTYTISGKAQKKSITDLLPGIISQLGQSDMTSLMEALRKSNLGGAGAGESEIPEVSSFEEKQQ